MDNKDALIVAEVAAKAACQLHAGTGNVSDALETASTLQEWIITAAASTEGYNAAVSELGAVPSKSTGVPACPKCGGDMWDNRKDKRNPKAPDFKCKAKDTCGHGIWN